MRIAMLIATALIATSCAKEEVTLRQPTPPTETVLAACGAVQCYRQEVEVVVDDNIGKLLTAIRANGRQVAMGGSLLHYGVWATENGLLYRGERPLAEMVTAAFTAAKGDSGCLLQRAMLLQQVADHFRDTPVTVLAMQH